MTPSWGTWQAHRRERMFAANLPSFLWSFLTGLVLNRCPCISGYAVAFTGMVGQRSGRGRPSSSASDLSTSSGARPSLPYDFLLDDVTKLPLHVMDYLETIDSTTQAATASMNDSGDNYAVDGTVDIKITNNYDSSVQTGERYRYPWKYVAEPYRPSRLTIDVGSFSEEETYTSDSVTWFKWLVDGHVQGYGDSIDVLFSELGEHEIVVAMKGADIEASPKFVVFKVMVKYVRREIRRLTDLDRESYFNAVQLMSYVPTEVGQSLYGLKYKSKDYFNRLHLYYGGTNDCDHWHAGAGFVTSHVTLTLEFEQSVQAIFPSLSQPYWDFTLESTFYDARSGGARTSSRRRGLGT